MFSAAVPFITRGATVDLTIEVRLEGIGTADVDFVVKLYDPRAFRGIATDTFPWLLFGGHRAQMVLRTVTFTGRTGTRTGDRMSFTL